jgi:RNA polymerase-binding transcription factor DksA
MANKKPTPHKAGKAASKKPAAKPAPKKAARKPASKLAARKHVRAGGAVPKKKEKARPGSKKIAAKPASKKTVPLKKPAAKGPQKPEAKPAAPVTPKPVARKNGAVDPKSLVSIKPTAKPVIKKEPPKPAKVVIPKTTTKSAVKYEPEFTKSVLDHPMYEQNGPSMRYSDADLAEFKELISKKLDAAKKELAYLQGLITRRDEGGDMDEARYMTMEDGSVSMEREQLSQMASRQITFIDHLEKAMMRIENKTYGICRVTGKLIDKARLRAVPHATLSIEAKQMMSK